MNTGHDDSPVGSCMQDFIHTVVGGTATQPPLVMAPGYAAGLAFYWRWVIAGAFTHANQRAHDVC